MSDRKRTILTNFCKGMAPSQIDKLLELDDGVSASVISGWWLDDKINRTGGIDSILGYGACDLM